MPKATLIEFQGEKHLLADLCARHGLDRSTVNYRLRAGWGLEEALTTPSQRGHKRPAPETNGQPDGDQVAARRRVASNEGAKPDIAPAPRIQPVATVPVLPLGGRALLDDARELIGTVVELLSAPETLELRRGRVLAWAREWLRKVHR